MEVKRYKACDAIAVVNGRIESADVVLATDYDLLSARHARAIEALRGCVKAMALHLKPRDAGNGMSVACYDVELSTAIASARTVLGEEAKG